MEHEQYSIQELMAVLIAREIIDGERVSVGTLSPLPAAGAWLALEDHAPNLELSVLGSDDSAAISRTDFFDAIQRGRCDLFFLSGAQIDRQANINLHVIGDYSSPQVRLPGGAGSGMIYYMAGRTILFLNRHSARNLVEQVDFITSAGSPLPGVFRRGYPSALITPLCTMRYNRKQAELILESVHPGTTLGEVKESTGWPLSTEGISVTVSPTTGELALLRSRVRAKMLKLYPEFTEKYIRKT